MCNNPISMFALNELSPNLIARNHKKLKVNVALTEKYTDSAIPQMQSILNEVVMEEELKDANREKKRNQRTKNTRKAPPPPSRTHARTHAQV